MERNHADPRPESHKIDTSSWCITDEVIGTHDHWRERKQWVLKRAPVHENLTELIEAANVRNELSLATFRPAKLLAFVVEPQTEQWDENKVAQIQAQAQQPALLPEWNPIEVKDLVNRLPWKFSYRFEDNQGRQSTLMIEDWEIGALYWNCLKSSSTAEEAIAKVRQRYWDEFRQKDLHFFLGTTRSWHGRGSNPFVIIGVFYPPVQTQPDLFD